MDFENNVEREYEVSDLTPVTHFWYYQLAVHIQLIQIELCIH